ISSAGDVNDVRETLDQVIAAVGRIIADQDRWTETLHLAPVRWEDIASEKTPEGSNSGFVRRAIECQLVIVIFRDRVGDGTREELIAVQNHAHTELAVIRIAPTKPKSAGAKAIKELLDHEQERVYYKAVPNEP